MALKRTARKTSEEQKPATSRKTLGNAANVVRTQRPAAAAKPAPKISDEEKREKILQERFAPESIEFLKRNFGIDLHSKQVPVNYLYDIADGRLTPEPLEAIIRPTAYSKESKSRIEVEPIRVVASFRFNFPFTLENGVKKYIAPTEKNPVAVAAFPCHDYLQMADPSETSVAEPAVAQEESTEKAEMPKFTPAQVAALEGLGISEERLYANSFNAISLDDKRAMLAGEEFPVSGTTRILDAETNTLIPVNVNGKAKMVTRKDGTVLTKFEPQYPVVKQNRQIVDLLSVRKIGNLELDFFDRDPKGHVKKDVYGNPVINQAGRDLIKYGVAFGPVDGFIHKRVYDPKMHEFRDSVTPDKYQVTLVNGGLCPTRMKKVMELDQNGNQIMTVSRTGEDVPKYHYECADAKVSGGKVRIGNQELEPATPKDLDSYKRGRGGVFKGCEYTDLKTKKRVVYDVFAVPDNQRGGFAKGFRPSVSEELIKRQQDAKKTVSKKQNFSMGF